MDAGKLSSRRLLVSTSIALLCVISPCLKLRSLTASRHDSIKVAREQPLQLLLSLLSSALLLRHGAREPHLPVKVLRQHLVAVFLLSQLVQDRAHEAPRVLRIGLHVCHDHLDVDVL